jgi:hypothetical protein
MNRIATIESALKAAYYDNFINTDAMARAVVKAVGAEPSMGLFYDIERIICLHIASDEKPDWRHLAEDVNAVLTAEAEDYEPHWMFKHLFDEAGQVV